MRHLTAVVVCGLLMWAAAAQAVVVGNPGAAAVGRGQIALGLESERFKDVFENDEVQSQRYLAKLTYGLRDRVDLFVKGGTGALNVDPLGVTAGSAFEGDSRTALGGGCRLETGPLPSFRNCRFFTNVQWLQFSSRGEFLRQQSHKTWTWDERLETSYRWKELGIALGFARSFEKVSVYTGLAMTRISGTVDRVQYVLSDDVSVRVGEGQESFTEGPETGLFLGFDVPLSGTLRFSTEYQMNGSNHGSFFIGISERMQ